MSSWDRSRRIPWSQIQQGNNEESVDRYRERIQEQIRREKAIAAEEATKKEEARKNSNGDNGNVVHSTKEDDENISWKKKIFSGKTYTNMDLFRQSAFGACVGTLTGAVRIYS